MKADLEAVDWLGPPPPRTY